MKRVVIVQARMGSSRLPGKILADLGGRPMLERQLDRLGRCREIDQVMLATTDQPADDAVVTIAENLGLGVYRGSEHDVLGRYAGAARLVDADVVIRSTADCPLIEPGVVDDVIRTLTAEPGRYDYVSNVVERSYPRGLDVEAMFRDVLERLDRMARSAGAREHVTQFILREAPDLFRVGSIRDQVDNSDLSWTVDTREDLERVRRLYALFGMPDGELPYRDRIRAARSAEP